jgi:hypothetical protein
MDIEVSVRHRTFDGIEQTWTTMFYINCNSPGQFTRNQVLLLKRWLDEVSRDEKDSSGEIRND